MKEKPLKVNLSSYMRRLHIRENATNQTRRKTINQQNSKTYILVGEQFIFKNYCFESYQWSRHNLTKRSVKSSKKTMMGIYLSCSGKMKRFSETQRSNQ